MSIGSELKDVEVDYNLMMRHGGRPIIHRGRHAVWARKLACAHLDGIIPHDVSGREIFTR